MLRQFDPALVAIDPFGKEAGDLAIPDPWGYEIDAYEEVYVQIERAVDGLIAFFTKGRN
jgi:protein-tyrosine-phosphatase